MASAIIQFVLAAAVIIVAGSALTRFADILADLTGLGRLLVGAVLLAAATSLPELMVDINAVLIGLPDIAVGDLMGSSLFNLLILAGIDLIHRTEGKMFSRMAGAHALSAAMSITLTAVAVILILVAPRWPNLTLGGIGVGSYILLGSYVLGLRMVYYDQRFAASQALAGQTAPAVTRKHRGLFRAVAGFTASAAVIFFAGPFLARAAGEIAEHSGLGTTFVGSTLVALSTSLPELVATYFAVRIKAFDLAIGNIFGSNAFNMVLLIPVDAFYPGSLLAAASATHAITGLFTVLITGIAVMGQLYHIEKRVFLLEPDASLIILLVLLAMTVLFLLR